MVKKLLTTSFNETRRTSLVKLSEAFTDMDKLKAIAGKNAYVDVALLSIAREDPILLAKLNTCVNVSDLEADCRKMVNNLAIKRKKSLIEEN